MSRFDLDIGVVHQLMDGHLFPPRNEWEQLDGYCQVLCQRIVESYGEKALDDCILLALPQELEDFDYWLKERSRLELMKRNGSSNA